MATTKNDFDGDSRDEILVTSPWGLGILKPGGSTMTAPVIAPNGTRFGGWLLNTADNKIAATANFDGGGSDEILVTSPWGIGLLKLSGNTLTAPMLAPNGTRFGDWLLNTADNRIAAVGDFDGDGMDEIVITSPWGLGILKVNGSTMTALMMAPNGTRFGGWLLNTADNRIVAAADFDGDGRDEILVTSPWGMGLLKLGGNTLTVPMMAPNGTRFGGWLLNTADNQVAATADFDGDGRDEILVTSPWGMGLLKLSGNTLVTPFMAPNGAWLGGWQLNTADNQAAAAADFDGDGRDEILITSPWGLGMLKWTDNAMTSPVMAPNGTRFGGWLLNTADNKIAATANYDSDAQDEILVTSPWGIGILKLSGNTLTAPFMAPNGTRFGGWLLNTADNQFRKGRVEAAKPGAPQPNQPPTLDELIRRFAPEVRLHPDDPFRPDAIEPHLARLQMKLDVRGTFGASDPLVLARGQVTPDNVNQQTARGQHSGSGGLTDFFLQIPNDDQEDAARRGNLGRAVCYVHTVPNADGQGATDIQYWFFYPYNGDLTKSSGTIGTTLLIALLKPLLGLAVATAVVFARIEHEGDFEHVTVRVKPDGAPDKAFYAAHDAEGAWHPFSSLMLNAEGRPVVYSARHSHASYTHPGSSHREGLNDFFAPDVTADGGPVWRTWENLEWVDRTNPNWLRYSGRWGEIGEFAFTTGPRGPLFKHNWNGDGEDGMGIKTGWLVFLEDNNGGGGTVGEANDAPQVIELTVGRPDWTNDQIRSLEMIRVRAGTVIRVFDSPEGSTSDDFTRITVKKDTPPRYVIGSFERSFEDEFVRVAHSHENGLDGKISRIVITRQ